MDTLNQGIDDLHQLESGAWRQNGTVVADALYDASPLSRKIEVTSYQLELVHGPGYPFA